MSKKRKDNNGRILRTGESQRENGTYDYRWRDKSGKRHSVYASSLQELRIKQKEITKNEVQGLQFTSTRMTLNDMYVIWAKLKRGVKDNTFQNYKYMYETFVQDEIGNYPINDLRKSDIRMFYNNLIEKRGLKISTLDSIHTVLYQVLEIAVEEDRIIRNPSHSALTEIKRTRNVDEPKRKSLTLKEQRIFESYLRKNKIANRWEPIFIIMLYTGLRVGEATGLTWDDINFETKTISVNRTLTYYKHEDGKTRFAVNLPKTKSSERTIPMIEIVREALIKEKQIQSDLNIEQVKVVDGISNFIFINRYGNPINQAPLNKALRRMIRLYNEEQLQKEDNIENITFLPNISCHSLRRTFTTRQVEANVNLKVLQEVLGHSDIRTTMNIYAEATEDLKHKEFKKYSDYINKTI